jgi:uncharacterized membrane protein YccF (DUF307 family)
MKTGANILWFILGGWLIGLLWLLAAAVMAISIIGLPWARACWEIAKLNLAPFGRDVISDRELGGQASAPLGALRLLANALWFPLGAVLTLSYLVQGCLLFVTIIGIPLGIQSFKLAGIALFPVGKRVVSRELADEARKTNARSELAALRAHRGSYSGQPGRMPSQYPGSQTTKGRAAPSE